MRILALIKGGAGSGDHGHSGRPGKAGGSGPAAPDSSDKIATLAEAEAYWTKHFANGAQHEIKCKYGKRTYTFHVAFARNHAFTADTHGLEHDEYRTFDLERSRRMDSIWKVLRAPHAVTWSERKPSNKVFDRELNLNDPIHGRVVLEPTPTADDLAQGRVTHFQFTSWHWNPDVKKIRALIRTIGNARLNPTQLKKASTDEALAFAPRTPPPATVGLLPISEGIPFNWSAYFYAEHHQNSIESGGGTGPQGKHTRCSLLSKSEIPEGARWITVHPNGPGSDGQPVLIQPNPDGSAHVIGGAGGKLNYLKLRSVRKESEYKAEAEQRKKDKQEKSKKQRAEDKKAGLTASKKKAREELRVQQVKHEQDFVRTVSDAMGWDKKETAFPEDKHADLSDPAINKLRNDHHREMLKRANEAVEVQRQQLLTDATTRLQADISEVPLDAKDSNTLSVQDLDPIPTNPGGLGFSADYKGRAKEAGLTDDQLQAESGKAREEKLAKLTDAQRKAAINRGDTAKRVREELDGIREPEVSATPKLADAKTAIDLLKAQKKLKAIGKQARDAGKKIDRSASEPKAYVLEYKADPDIEKRVAADLESDLRTASTRAFLSEVQQLAGKDATQTLGKHIGIGAYNSVNSLALAVSGDALVDRSVVDVLGIAGAAQVLARRIHSDFDPTEVEHITDGMQDFHVSKYLELGNQSIAKARGLMAEAKAVELGEAASGAELQVAQELNKRRSGSISEAQKTLGQALGEMEANAALVVALKQGKKDQFQVSLGKVTAEAAIRQARALGMQRGDYAIEHVAGDTFLTVAASGLDRLAKPINRDDVAQVRRNLDIIDGKHDEDGWLPRGIAKRPDLVMNAKPGVAPRLAEPFQPSGDLHQSLRDYIGGRMADGDSPADIVADVQSADFFRKAGNPDEYRKALDAVAPLKDENGKMQRAEALAGKFDEYADAFTEQRYGGKRSTLNKQSIQVDQKSVDALHRSLAETPEGTAAYKQIGELTGDDQRAIRDYFYANVAKESPETSQTRTELERHTKDEPERETTDMFGEKTTNPEWSDWSKHRDALRGKVNAASLDWAKYIDTMGGHEPAYEAVQDLIRSKVGRSFADTYNTLNPKEPIKIGKSTIRHDLNHLDATDPAARESRQAKERSLVDGLRERSQGRYAGGGVAEKLDAAREERDAFEQAQMGFFSREELPQQADTPLGGDERHTLGHVAERQIAGMMGVVGQNFKPGQPTKIWNPTMSGGKNAARQRLVKMVDANKRVVAAFGTGAGKSLLQLGAFTHLQQQGKAKRGLFLVPSIVQGQFNGEALRYLEPGKFNWHAEPGATQADRIAAHKNADHHFTVMTHSSFRDDMLHLGAKHAGVDETAMSEQLNKMTPAERKDWMRGIMDREGINYDYLTVDESQATVNRRGKENSGLANVIDATSAHTPYYLMASADPVKNDASEVHDVMRKMDPERYSDRQAFMRRYGADTAGSKDALRREMARYVYPSKIDPDVQADRKEMRVPLSDGQRTALDGLSRNFATARLARMTGKVDVNAVKAISPTSFEGAPEDKHEAIAKDLQQNLGILKSSAIHRVINTHPDNPNIEQAAKVATERKGKPGVVFAHSLEAVKMLKERFERDGHRVVTITGADSATEKDRKRLAFSPESGEATADILVASDAGATGMNIQRGQWLYQYDTPQTAMLHAQRNGRIYRTGQKNNVELIDGVPDHPEIHRARERLRSKYGLRDVMTSPMEGLDETGVAGYLKHRQTVNDDV